MHLFRLIKIALLTAQKLKLNEILYSMNKAN